jgi:hypothetical protein
MLMVRMASCGKSINMKRKRVFFILKWAGAAMVVLLLIHHIMIRPWMLDWGAPEKIQHLVLSGDTLVSDETHHTRAVLVKATPDEIWPWLLQLGQERGGFYSYTWLENIFAADMHNVYTQRLELQHSRPVGDTIWMADKNRYGGMGHQLIGQIIPCKSFVMVGDNDYARLRRGEKAMGSWSIYIYPEDDSNTWLIARSSISENTSKAELFLRYFTYEVPHFIMEQKMLRTMRDLSEKKSLRIEDPIIHANEQR